MTSNNILVRTPTPAFRPAPYAIGALSRDDDANIDLPFINEGSDDLMMMLSTTVAPKVSQEQGDYFEVSLDEGVIRWTGADGHVHQVGENHKPLPTAVLSKLSSYEGLLVAFIDQKNGRPVHWVVFKTESVVTSA